MRRERVERPFAGERIPAAVGLEAVVVGRLVGDVLADPFLSAAAQPHDRGHTREAARHGLLEPFELVALDHERQAGDASVGAQPAAFFAALSAAFCAALASFLALRASFCSAARCFASP